MYARLTSGHAAVHVSEVFPLQETPAALAAVGAGHPSGKVVVEVRPRDVMASGPVRRGTRGPGR
ncbi:zinc-binding dehydrogenase [Pseudactinotalea sp.]|uniref:zinc-binding dehydrogenase n=1 Tax=Pseudactinotalea sp. TaxID=1926260 RepID=UPI003B3BC880